MAALQKIRNRGPLILILLGVALFGFIASDWQKIPQIFTSLDQQKVGEVCGKSINIQEFNEMVEQYADVIKFSNGMASLNEEQMNSIRDQVWQSYTNQRIIENECEKLGITVTDAEVQDIITSGSNPMLAQTPFRGANGAFDVNALKQFLTQYDELKNNAEIPAETKEQYDQMFNFWKFIEKSIREQTLQQKYQALLAGSLISNPIAAKQAFDGRVQEKDLLIAALPYNSIKDTEVTVEDADLKAKYESMKDIFLQMQETRNIKYIDINVKASKEDEDALNKEMAEYSKALKEGADVAKVVRESSSSYAYSVLPVSAKALPSDIAGQLDSLKEGVVVGPYYNNADNTINVVELISRVQRPDSVEVRQLAVAGIDDKAKASADSIYRALTAGADFDTIAKAYNQPATKNWITSAQYEGMSMDENNRKLIEAMTTSAKGSIQKVELDGGIIIMQITDTKNVITKYDIAVIKRTLDFSKDTYGKAYSKFGEFLASNKTIEEIEANAQKSGYTVLTRQDMSANEHYVAGIRDTHDALKWVFNEDTKVGDVSGLYECGENDHMLAVVLTGIHEKGYRDMNDEQVKEFLTSEVMKDKKAEMLQKKMEGKTNVKAIAAIPGAVTDTLKHVNFTSSAFVPKMGAAEPALSGSASVAQKGAFKTGVKGNAGVYAYQVLSETTNKEAKFDAKTEKASLVQMAMRGLSGFTNELLKKANVTDNRYLFF